MSRKNGIRNGNQKTQYRKQKRVLTWFGVSWRLNISLPTTSTITPSRFREGTHHLTDIQHLKRHGQIAVGVSFSPQPSHRDRHRNLLASYRCPGNRKNPGLPRLSGWNIFFLVFVCQSVDIGRELVKEAIAMAELDFFDNTFGVYQHEYRNTILIIGPDASR